MADRLRRIGRGFVEAFLRDNRVLPPVLAVLALFIIAWILAGAFMGEPNQKPIAHKADLAQSDNGNPGGNPVSGGVENRDVNSYAAYRSKDPFRELFAPETTAPETTATTPPERTTPETTTGTGRTPGGPGAASRDTDRDGIPDRRERTMGTNPNNPDTDGDGIPDGSDNDANDDGRPDTGRSGTGAATRTGPTPNTGGPVRRGGTRAPGGRRDNLLNSGGILPLP